MPLPLFAAGVLLVAVWPLGTLRPGSLKAGSPARGRGEEGWVRGVDAVAASLGLLLLLASLGPETAWDGFEYHLPLVAAWTEAPIRPVPGMLDAEFRAGIDLLYVPTVTAGLPDAAAAVSACFALALAALVRAEASRRASPGAGALAGLLVLLTPLTVELAPSTYVDLGVGAYGFAALLFADRWNRGASTGALFFSAVSLGFAANAKLHAAVLCPVVLALVLVGGRRPSLLRLGQLAAVVAALVAPWLVKVGLSTGNPFFPLLGGWLGTGPTDETNLAFRRVRLLANYPASRDAAGLLQYLVSVSFGRNPHVGGLLGPLPLALAPWSVGRPSRATAVLVALLAALVVLQFFFMPALRFGVAVWSWLAVAAAVGGRRLATSGPELRAGLALVLVALMVHQGAAAAARLVPRVLALRDPRAHERATFPDQDALRRMVGRAEPVVGIPMGAVSWMPRPVYNLLWERNGELYFGGGMPAGFPLTPPDVALALLYERGVASLVLDLEPPHPADGRTGHPTVDAWLEAGDAAIATDVAPLPARPPRSWHLIRLRAR